MHRNLCILLIPLMSVSAYGQKSLASHQYDRGDSLRGALTPLRTCYDVTYYDLFLRVDVADKFIEGANAIYFIADSSFQDMQIDLFRNLGISEIRFRGKPATFSREYNAVFVHLPEMVVKGHMDSITIIYKGNPVIAQNPPWDGGFTFTKDKNKNDWVSVSCEGIGASIWWPCKDHLSDEPDSMSIRISAPANMVCVANGNLRGIGPDENGYRETDWFVSYPINNYDVSFSLGDYVHFSDVYTSADRSDLNLDYYVLSYNLQKAKKQFTQVKPMLACYEQHMGKYPFYRDGYALIETPYLGMEHQSGIAYGNEYKSGYDGFDISGLGMQWDYIIIHESAHEWWGNNVSMRDLADMWIHEAFATYSEAIYVECMYGPEEATQYMNARKRFVENDMPIIGDYNVNREGSDDMYYKGALMLNTIRHLIDNDSLWWSILKGIQRDFALQTISSAQIENYINEHAGMDLSGVFDQYLRHSNPPVFEYTLEQKDSVLVFRYRWDADVPDFSMPIRAKTDPNGNFKWLHPTPAWQEMDLKGGQATDLQLDTDDFYFLTSQLK